MDRNTSMAFDLEVAFDPMYSTICIEDILSCDSCADAASDCLGFSPQKEEDVAAMNFFSPAGYYTYESVIRYECPLGMKFNTSAGMEDFTTISCDWQGSSSLVALDNCTCKCVCSIIRLMTQ